MGALVEGLRSRVLVVVAMIVVELLGGANFSTGPRNYENKIMKMLRIGDFSA